MGWITLERGNRTDGYGWVVVVRMTGLKWGRTMGLRDGIWGGVVNPKDQIRGNMEI